MNILKGKGAVLSQPIFNCKVEEPRRILNKWARESCTSRSYELGNLDVGLGVAEASRKLPKALEFNKRKQLLERPHKIFDFKLLRIQSH